MKNNWLQLLHKHFPSVLLPFEWQLTSICKLFNWKIHPLPNENLNKQSQPYWSKDPFLKPFCWFIIFVRKMQVTTFYESKGPAWKKVFIFSINLKFWSWKSVTFLWIWSYFLLTWKWTWSQIIRSWLKIEDVFSATNGNDFGL